MKNIESMIIRLFTTRTYLLSLKCNLYSNVAEIEWKEI
jgi:hypothetical protein